MRDLTTKNDGITRSKERITKNGEVFTPKALVEKMMDKIPAEKWKIRKLRSWNRHLVLVIC